MAGPVPHADDCRQKAVSEWDAVRLADPDGAARRLLPVRVDTCAPPESLRSVMWIDLSGLAEDEARAQLVNAVNLSITGPVRPTRPPVFPGAHSPTGTRQPVRLAAQVGDGGAHPSDAP